VVGSWQRSWCLSALAMQMWKHEEHEIAEELLFTSPFDFCMCKRQSQDCAKAEGWGHAGGGHCCCCGLHLLCQLPCYHCERDCLSSQKPSWAPVQKQSKRILVLVSRPVHLVAFAMTDTR